MLLSVVIITYNTRAMTLDCLRTLMPELVGIESEVFVVDNASTDGTADAVAAAFPQVRYILNAQNVGFGAANNQAMKAATGEFFLLLNSDAFPKPGTIATLLQELQAQPKTGVLGPRLLNADGTLQLSCFKFPSPGRAWAENLWLAAAFPRSALGDYRRWPHDTPRQVEWIVGACMLVRRQVYEQVGGFDERFFMYAEESDWQLRIGQAGWGIAFTPHAQVTHLAGASNKDGSARMNSVFFESLDYYERKHHGLAGLFSLRLAMGIGCTLRLLLWCLVLIIPGKRRIARQKISLHAHLTVRQLALWNVFNIGLSRSLSEPIA